MRILILEDDVGYRVPIFRAALTKKPNVTLVFAETAGEAIAALSASADKFDLIFLDHDLGGQPPNYYGQFTDITHPNTGSEVVRWMISNMITRPPVIIHSLNAPAALDMKSKLEHAYFTCHYIPFSSLKHHLDDPSFITIAE